MKPRTYKILNLLLLGIPEDIKTVNYIFNQLKEGKPVLNPEKVQAVKESVGSFGQMMKSFIPFLLLALGAFALGWAVAGKYYEIQCNELLVQMYNNLTATMPDDILNLTIR